MTQENPLDRIGFKLEDWKRQLIDLSRRNKLLNYRPTKRTTVEVVDELPQMVLRQLLDGETFKFDPIPEEDETEDPEDPEDQESLKLEDVEPSDEAEEPDPRNLETRQTFSGSTGDDLAEHHTDDRLQTRYTEERLEKNLTAIYRKAESSLEEEGVNTLFLALGMLEWYESRSSDTSSLAPLVLVPVTLSRETAASPFTLTLRDEEPVLNPALIERLKQDFNIELSELPDLTSDLDVEQVFHDVADSVSGFERWRLTQDVVLGQFSFQKFLMFRDLEDYADRFRDKGIIRAICMEEDEERRIGLPPEIGDADLDEEMSPWETVQIRDSDSSQQRAMLAVRRGQNLVIEGPPGTGKSQTISNIIADQLAEGRKVLFVSEKMAALEVVKARLDASDLGAFCLELHSNKTQKTAFVGELREALNYSGDVSGDHQQELRRLEKLAEELRTYVEELHRPVDPVGWSPFEAIADLAEVEDAPRVLASVPSLMDLRSDQYEDTLENLRRLSSSLDEIGDPGEHPLRGVGLTHVGRTDRHAIEERVDEAGSAVGELTEVASDAAQFFGFKTPETLGDVDLMLEGSNVVARSPGADVSVLENPRWNEMSAEAQELLTTGKRYAERRDAVKSRFGSEIQSVDAGEVADRFEQHLEDGVWRFFKPAYWRTRSEAREHLRSDYSPEDNEELLQDLRTAEGCQSDREWLASQDELGRELFGDRWNGPGSDWTELEELAEWVVELRKYALEEVLGQRGFRVAAEADLDPETAEEHRRQVRTALAHAKEALQDLLERCEMDPESSGIKVAPDAEIGRTGRRIDEMETNLDKLRSYSNYRAAHVDCDESPAGPFVHEWLSEGRDPEQLVRAFRRLFLERWLEKVFEDRPTLQQFRSEEHDRRLRRFRELDERSKAIAEERAQKALLEQRRKVMDSDLRGQLQRVQKEAKKQRRIMPIRKLLKRSPDVVQLIKPCFMMSPLSVAKYLDPEIYDFDLLVFDEASQIPPADAVGSMIRADQVVVVGDEKQLPPTKFFAPDLEGEDEVDDEELELLEDMESILEQVAISGVPSVRLKWHYRSEHESLIRFSNEKFYEDDPLYTFPHPARDHPEFGLQFEYLEDAVYEGRGENPVEAERVADEVVRHIREHPDLSLGIGTFGMAQQRRIQDELDQRRREHPEIEWFFSQEGEDKFFVKNLENIQGDDRDVIFLSVTYGPDEDGTIRRHFGPINRDGGWKRLNVLTTRAKKRLRVFSSMRGDDIDPRGIKRGAKLLRDYLKYAESGQMPSSNVSLGPPESPFERAVKREVEKLGYEVVSQVGESPYRIDLGVLDPDRPGRYLCGIECDGATYHRQATVRDRDRIRQQVLEDRGWDIHRIWSTDWFHDRPGQIERLEELLEQSRRRQDDEQDEGVDSDDRGSKAPQAPQEHNPGAGERQDDGGGPPPGLSDEHKVPIEEIDVPSYRVAEPQSRGNSDAFYNASPAEIGEVVEEVLEVEAPVPFRMLARRVARAWGLSQTGSNIRARVKKGIERLERAGKAKRRDDFVWYGRTSEVPVRSRDIDAIQFKAKHLPPGEVEEAVRVLLRHRAPLLPDDIPSEAARLLGFKRTGKKLRKTIERAVERLREKGEIEPSGTGIRLDEEDSSGRLTPRGTESARGNTSGEAPTSVEESSSPGEDQPSAGANLEADWRNENLSALGEAIMEVVESAHPESLTAPEIRDQIKNGRSESFGDVDKSNVNRELYKYRGRWLHREEGRPPKWSLVSDSD